MTVFVENLNNIGPQAAYLAVSFGLCALLTYLLLPVLRRLKAGQAIREDGPKAHLAKAGTPTMGG
ncbi:MAG: hypothetical protein II617_03270, partial [Firmicutes bacterium]|nr:hypothetical protein [Bacillota bacterium]